jgi:hypothetical protein
VGSLAGQAAGGAPTEPENEGGDDSGSAADRGGAGGSPAVVGGADGAAGESCTPAPSAAVAWWPGDGSFADVVGDSDGEPHHGATFGPGIVDEAMLFDGVDDFVDAGNAASLRVSGRDFTVSAWVFFESLQGDMSIVDKMSDGGVNLDGWRLLKQEDQRFWFCFGGGIQNECFDPAFTVFSTTVAAVGHWYHLAAVKEANRFAVYVNGKLEDSRSPVPPFLDTGAASLRLGSYALQGSYLHGALDDVRLFDAALSEAEIVALLDSVTSHHCP